ncbi:MAG: nicotinate phosphoribosyltransferase [Oscillospiraceae bacterium]
MKGAPYTRNLTLLMDFYELTMAAGYFEDGYKDQIAVFDMFYRQNPDGGGFAIAAGLQQFIEAVENFSFSPEDIQYLREKEVFSEEFLAYLLHFEFHCNIWAVEEGTPIFPSEHMVTVEGPCIETQLIETLLLVTFNHQSLICTKANRVVRACEGRPVMEFGARRAQGYDAALYGARAAYIGGVAATSCVLADRAFGIPVSGTMAHSWVQMFDSEYEAFERYARLYPDNCMLLVDTYSVLKSGVPNAIKAFNNVLKPLGYRPTGIRIDSGDISYLSKRARKMLDEAGYADCKICASNSLDEYIVRDLFLQGAKVDLFGIGENLITSKSDPVFGGVYKMAAVKHNGQYIPKIKISETAAKITIPHLKKLWRIFDNTTGKAMADYITMYNEEVKTEGGITLFDPIETWKRRTFTGCRAELLSVPVYAQGKLVYQMPTLQQIRRRCGEQVETLWDEVRRFENPHRYYVDLSQNLWDERQRLLQQAEH